VPTAHIVDVQLRLMETINGQLGGLSQKIDGMQRQADGLGKTMKAAFAFHELERFGRVGMDAFGGMIQQASNLQLAMSKVQIATSASGKEMKSLGDLIVDTSSKHAMSAMQAADMMAVVARTGMDKRTIGATFGSISTFADIQKMERGMDFEQSAKIAATTARFFGARTPEATERVLDNLYKAMNSSPMQPSQLLTSLQNFAPGGQQLGMTQEETFQAASLMGTMGLGSKGGTGLFNVLLRSIGKTPAMTGHREGEQTKALRDLGLTREMIAPGGKFSFESLFTQLSKRGQEMGAEGKSGQFVKDLIGAFNDRGGRVAAALATPDAIANLNEMLASWKTSTSLQGAYNIEQKNAAYQASVLKTNLQNLGATAGKLSNETLTPLTKRFGDLVANLDSYLKSSPHLSTVVGAGVLGGEGLSALAAGVGKVGSAASGLNALRGFLTGTGARVYVTNMPAGGLGGMPGGGGLPGFLGKLGAATAAGAIGYGLGTLMDELFTKVVGKSIGEKHFDVLFGAAEKRHEAEMQKAQAAKTHALDKLPNEITFHGAVFHVHDAHDAAALMRELRKSISRGGTTTSPGGKPGGVAGP
jgi:TP901 family phage tail tape measure protein